MIALTPAPSTGMNTFRKNKAGEWVVQGAPADVRVGKVLVEKKDGSKKYVAVLSVGRPFKGFDGSMMVYGYLTETNEETPAPAPVAVEPVVSESSNMSGVPDDCVF